MSSPLPPQTAPSAAPRHGPIARFIIWLDRCAFTAMGVGVALMLQPWLAEGLRIGLFVALIGTVAQIITGHLRPQDPA